VLVIEAQTKVAYIVPWHPACVEDGQSVASVVIDVFEVHNAGIVVVLTREESGREVRGMDIG
jgi:hypothetical protein